MTPAGLGGRRRNAWSPSRQRKLVRLYTLTTLTKEEIQKVLRAPNFNPSSSDIQKKLRALFPSDYAKEYRKYRPSNDTNMKLRFDNLRRCKRGRISKEKRLRSRMMSRDTVRMYEFWRVHPNSVPSHEIPTHAFRDYTMLSSYDAPIMVSRDLANSEPVSSMSLLLDESSISTTANYLNSDIGIAISTNELTDNSTLNIRMRAGSESTRWSASPHSKHLQSSAKRASSIRSLGRQLADKYSEAYLKRISSIMRYSSSDSWRSSLASFSSRASSLLSRVSASEKSNVDEVSQSYHRNSTSTFLAAEPVQNSAPWKPLPVSPWERGKSWRSNDQILASSTEHEITNKELEVWNELIDESKLRPGPHLHYLAVSLLDRKCCAVFFQFATGRCASCGCVRERWIALLDGIISPYGKPFFNQLDFYGNNLLHYAAASANRNGFRQIRRMIWPGAHLSQCNTFGETFLHILCRNGPRTLADIRDFLSILRDLDGAGFPFSKRDYHGRTILHVMFQNSNDNSYIAPCLSEIFNIMKPNLSMKDNTGFSVQEHLEEHFDQATTQYDNLRAVVAPWCKPSYLPLPLIHSQPSLFPNNHEEYFRAWFENNTKPDYISSIDGAGDSPLISLLKHWEQDTSKDLALMQAAEQMVRSGAIIHMRDRDGNTALTVAARRGFRPVVTFLLGKGAIVHSRSYRGVGVLKQIEQALAHAQTAQDENLWAHIWSCQTALVDAGAIINPTERDEWKLPTSECWGG